MERTIVHVTTSSWEIRHDENALHACFLLKNSKHCNIVLFKKRNGARTESIYFLKAVLVVAEYVSNMSIMKLLCIFLLCIYNSSTQRNMLSWASSIIGTHS